MTIKSFYKPILTAEQMRKAEQQTMLEKNIDSLALMERAGQIIAHESHKHKLDSGRIVFIVGSGSNGGDGLVAARLLRLQNIPVTVIPLLDLENIHGDIQHQTQRALDVGVKIRPLTKAADAETLENWLKRAVLVVDALFGTGLNKPITGWLAKAINIINQAHCPTLSVDIASGIHADTGETQGIAIQADVTLPIAAYKW
ncbi:MAG: NAD(P)H-hydrate epimerase, partial [Ghiorsea sp.]|nr:NAD(P)H-hydrate epimerase [Ghiorsea sp.]